MAYSSIILDCSEGVATITLNRPAKSNAFDDTQVAELLDALTFAERDRQIRAIVITGAGKNFCAGQDLGPMLERGKTSERVSLAAHLRKTYNVVVPRMHALEKPIIAAVNGAAAGAGLGLACACDLRFASDTAKFRTAFIGIALAPDSAISFMLPRLIGFGRANEMAMTNELVDAQTALQWGLVNRVFKADELMARSRELALQLAHLPTKSIGLTKRAFNYSLYADLESALENEAVLQDIAGSSADHHEGVNAFIEKRTPEFQGR